MAVGNAKRLAYLVKLVEAGSTEPMALYGLAMEQRVCGQNEAAVATFAKLRAAHPSYVAMYLMCAQTYEALGDRDQARTWLAFGITEAKRTSDGHALGELESMLSTLQ